MSIIVYLRLLGIPLALFGWIIYQRIVKRKPWKELGPDFGLAVFVCAVWGFVYFILLK